MFCRFVARCVFCCVLCLFVSSFAGEREEEEEEVEESERDERDARERENTTKPREVGKEAEVVYHIFFSFFFYPR